MRDEYPTSNSELEGGSIGFFPVVCSQLRDVINPALAWLANADKGKLSASKKH